MKGFIVASCSKRSLNMGDFNVKPGGYWVLEVERVTTFSQICSAAVVHSRRQTTPMATKPLKLMENFSRPINRALDLIKSGLDPSKTVIHLRITSPQHFSNLPALSAGTRPGGTHHYSIASLRNLKYADARRISQLMAVALSKSCNAAYACFRLRPSGLTDESKLFVSVSQHATSMLSKHCLDLGLVCKPEMP
jgi:hypothetical protein